MPDEPITLAQCFAEEELAEEQRDEIRRRVNDLHGTAIPTGALASVLAHLDDPALLAEIVALKATEPGAVPSGVDRAWTLTEDRVRAAAAVLLLSRRTVKA